MKELNEDDLSEIFIKLLAEHERRLTAYVMTFVPREADADGILQETKLRLWRSFDQFVAERISAHGLGKLLSMAFWIFEGEKAERASI